MPANEMRPFHHYWIVTSFQLGNSKTRGTYSGQGGCWLGCSHYCLLVREASSFQQAQKGKRDWAVAPGNSPINHLALEVRCW